MNNLTKKNKLKKLLTLRNATSWLAYTNHPMHYKFMQAHNDLLDYRYSIIN